MFSVTGITGLCGKRQTAAHQAKASFLTVAYQWDAVPTSPSRCSLCPEIAFWTEQLLPGLNLAQNEYFWSQRPYFIPVISRSWDSGNTQTWDSGKNILLPSYCTINAQMPGLQFAYPSLYACLIKRPTSKYRLHPSAPYAQFKSGIKNRLSNQKSRYKRITLNYQCYCPPDSYNKTNSTFYKNINFPN